MNSTNRLATLLGTASLLTMTGALAAQAQQVAQAQMAQATPEEVPEQVLITGSLIHGTAAVGVPVTNLSPQDFAQAGALTTADLFRTVPGVNVAPGAVATNSGANIERATRINIRQLDTGNATRSLLMVDGVRFPPQGNGVCAVDPSVIPALALDRVDVLLDGSSATYGSDAVAGVINLILKRGYDGAITQVRGTFAGGGRHRYMASQLWGRTWDGGDITLSYEWYDENPVEASQFSKMTQNFTPWGFNDRTPLASSMPGTISLGGPVAGSPNPNGLPASFGTTCTNCYAIPHSTGGNFAPGLSGAGPAAGAGVASTLTWNGTTFVNANSAAAGFGAHGTANEQNPYNFGWYDAAQARNGGAITFDQRLTQNITAYGEGFFSNRRGEYKNPPFIGPASNNDLSIQVPTFNPYYPNAASGFTVPTNIRVNYTTALENPSITHFYEVANRYLVGLHIALPGDWNADIYTSKTYDSSFNHVSGTVNQNAVSAALGWTIGSAGKSQAAVGSFPAIATWTKPSTVPFLNLFCDPTQFLCNSSTTLDYVSGIRQFDETYYITEHGAKFDGPLFDLPGGTVKAAVGFTYDSSSYNITELDTTTSTTLIAPSFSGPVSRTVWAGFAQINIPIFEEQNALPLLRKLEFEASWRHDQYSDFGGTSNPKLAVNWQPHEWVTFRGAWGTNFRAPGFGELSQLANNAIALQNPIAGPSAPGAASGNINFGCGAGAGSAIQRFTNPGTAVNGALLGPACGSSYQPEGMSFNGGWGSPNMAGWRTIYNNPIGGTSLKPETATNWSAGIEIAPTTFLTGLDIQATWFSVKINGVLNSFGNPNNAPGNLADPSLAFAYIVPTDLAYLHTAAGDLQCHNNTTPGNLATAISATTAGCPEFEQMVLGMMANPRNTISPAEQTNILWLNDGGTFNIGTEKLTGVDFSWSYDYDAGDIGAFNIGQVGTYYLEHPQAATGAATDIFHFNNTINGQTFSGIESQPRLRYRARLGWSNGPYSITGFVNYVSHFYNTQSLPPNVNNQCVAGNPSIPGAQNGGGNSPCALTGYLPLEPAAYTLDMSFGYDTGDDPANDYLKHIGIQFVVQNIMGKRPPFEYRISTGAGNPSAVDASQPGAGNLEGRSISVILTKTW